MCAHTLKDTDTGMQTDSLRDTETESHIHSHRPYAPCERDLINRTSLCRGSSTETVTVAQCRRMYRHGGQGSPVIEVLLALMSSYSPSSAGVPYTLLSPGPWSSSSHASQSQAPWDPTKDEWEA